MADLTYSYVREPRNATSISISTLPNITQTIACAEDFTLLYIYNLSNSLTAETENNSNLYTEHF